MRRAYPISYLVHNPRRLHPTSSSSLTRLLREKNSSSYDNYPPAGVGYYKLSGLVRHITMAQSPILKRRRPSSDGDDDAQNAEDAERETLSSLSRPISPPPKTKRVKVRARIASPFRLTSIRDLSDEDNVGAVSLNDLIGDPLIAELWDFNYLHDIEFLRNHLDEDTRALTKIHVVHGFWKREDQNRILLHVSFVLAGSDLPIFSK